MVRTDATTFHSDNVDMLHVADGKIQEHWDSAMQQ
jgi:predicted SnoaL-like aldol condensation-catalyzing enzyme